MAILFDGRLKISAKRRLPTKPDGSCVMTIYVGFFNAE
jgi:hypothetical protein